MPMPRLKPRHNPQAILEVVIFTDLQWWYSIKDVLPFWNIMLISFSILLASIT